MVSKKIKPTPTEEALKMSLPADLRNLTPEEVQARQSIAPLQSIPPPAFPTQRGIAQPTTTPDISAISGEPLAINRINKFFLPKGEVTREEFDRFKAESKILAEGGRRVVSDEERARIEKQISQQAQETIPSPEQITPTQEEVGAGQRELATGLVLAGTLAFGAASIGAKIGASRLASGGLLKSLGLGGFSIPVLSQRKKVSEANNNFDNSKDIVSDAITAIQSGQMSLEQGIVLINAEIANINNSEKALKILTSDSLISFISGGANGLADIETFRRDYQNIILPALIRSSVNQEVLRQQQRTSF